MKAAGSIGIWLIRVVAATVLLAGCGVFFSQAMTERADLGCDGCIELLAPLGGD